MKPHVNPPASHAERFHQWLLEALSNPPAGAELTSVGPFRVVLWPAADEAPWVTLVDPPENRLELEESVGRLRSMLAGQSPGWRIEYQEEVMPRVEPWLVALGFELNERNPLMACEPGEFQPQPAGDAVLTRLLPDSPGSDLSAFQHIRWTSGGENDNPVPAVDRLQRELAETASVYMLAWLDGEPAGTGVSHPLGSTAEIVGVVTRADRRGRGVAGAVTSELVTRHFASGGDFVFLDASGEPAARVYARLGFTRFGANLVFG
jgi:GNAT superfamily N-acetyltransferase